jgi:hypothetical protein
VRERPGARHPGRCTTWVPVSGRLRSDAEGSSASSWVCRAISLSLPRSGAARLARARRPSVGSRPSADDRVHVRHYRQPEGVSRSGTPALSSRLWLTRPCCSGPGRREASVVGARPRRCERWRGVVALGGPLGVSGFRLVLTLGQEMRRRGAKTASRRSVVAVRARRCLLRSPDWPWCPVWRWLEGCRPVGILGRGGS